MRWVELLARASFAAGFRVPHTALADLPMASAAYDKWHTFIGWYELVIAVIIRSGQPASHFLHHDLSRYVSIATSQAEQSCYNVWYKK
jgi:hypothetical protein